MQIQNYEYIPTFKKSLIQVPASLIKSNTLMEFIPDPICSDQTSCSDCLKPGVFHSKCYWCPRARRCTDSHDINRLLWLRGECGVANITNCFAPINTHTNPTRNVNRPRESADSLMDSMNIIQKPLKNNIELSNHIARIYMDRPMEIVKPLEMQLLTNTF
ncbi:unnamed protein product [Schistosoma turkestanicum]|nr:unnamed protein product [Schistosoma turkestanicum]